MPWNTLGIPSSCRIGGRWRRASRVCARQRQIMELVLAGRPSKNIAADLAISQRTVENHRAAVMKKTGSHSLSALIRLALAADPGTTSQSLG
jgi:two-component system, chemotaxis family, CheB/CheR fusion protein